MAAYLEMHNITKVYPNGVVAVKAVDFDVERGEIHALLGENGAGKSTLMKVLFGIEPLTTGKIFLKGRQVHIPSPHTAIGLKVGMVHQHFMLVPSLTVAENLVLGMEPRRGVAFLRDKAIEIVKDLGKRYGLSVPAQEVVEDLPVGLKQRAEILKALLREAECLILDEPTAVLTPLETNELFLALKMLAEEGKAIIFITHKLKEVKEVADRITVLRDGQKVGTTPVAEVSEVDMVRMMVGRDVELSIKKQPAKRGAEVFAVQGLTCVREDGHVAVRNVSFEVAAGEILAIAGVMGNGQTELVETLTGLRKAASGTVRIHEQDLSRASPRKIRLYGVAHIPADRMGRGVAAEASIEENLISDRYFKQEFTRPGILGIKRKNIKAHGEKLRKEFAIKAQTAVVSVEILSGGNIQRVVVAREFTANAKLMIADQPTRGIDVASTEYVRQRLINDRDAGMAVLLVSADLTEVMQLADRIAVMYNGEIVAHFPTTDGVTAEELGKYMLGIKRHSDQEIVEEAAVL